MLAVRVKKEEVLAIGEKRTAVSIVG